MRRSWPGLAREACELCLRLGLPNIVKEEIGCKKWESRYKKDGWKCDGCELEVESNAHVIECVAYDHVRDGKDLNCDKDLVQYFKEVMTIRMRKSKL